MATPSDVTNKVEDWAKKVFSVGNVMAEAVVDKAKETTKGVTVQDLKDRFVKRKGGKPSLDCDEPAKAFRAPPGRLQRGGSCPSTVAKAGLCKAGLIVEKYPHYCVLAGIGMGCLPMSLIMLNKEYYARQLLPPMYITTPSGLILYDHTSWRSDLPDSAIGPIPQFHRRLLSELYNAFVVSSDTSMNFQTAAANINAQQLPGEVVAANNILASIGVNHTNILSRQNELAVHCSQLPQQQQDRVRQAMGVLHAYAMKEQEEYVSATTTTTTLEEKPTSSDSFWERCKQTVWGGKTSTSSNDPSATKAASHDAPQEKPMANKAPPAVRSPPLSFWRKVKQAFVSPIFQRWKDANTVATDSSRNFRRRKYHFLQFIIYSSLFGLHWLHYYQYSKKKGAMQHPCPAPPVPTPSVKPTEEANLFDEVAFNAVKLAAVGVRNAMDKGAELISQVNTTVSKARAELKASTEPKNIYGGEFLFHSIHPKLLSSLMDLICTGMLAVGHLVHFVAPIVAGANIPFSPKPRTILHTIFIKPIKKLVKWSLVPLLLGDLSYSLATTITLLIGGKAALLPVDPWHGGGFMSCSIFSEAQTSMFSISLAQLCCVRHFFWDDSDNTLHNYYKIPRALIFVSAMMKAVILLTVGSGWRKREFYKMQTAAAPSVAIIPRLYALIGLFNVLDVFSLPRNSMTHAAVVKKNFAERAVSSPMVDELMSPRSEGGRTPRGSSSSPTLVSSPTALHEMKPQLRSVQSLLIFNTLSSIAWLVPLCVTTYTSQKLLNEHVAKHSRTHCSHAIRSLLFIDLGLLMPLAWYFEFFTRNINAHSFVYGCPSPSGLGGLPPSQQGSTSDFILVPHRDVAALMSSPPSQQALLAQRNWEQLHKGSRFGYKPGEEDAYDVLGETQTMTAAEPGGTQVFMERLPSSNDEGGKQTKIVTRLK